MMLFIRARRNIKTDINECVKTHGSASDEQKLVIVRKHLKKTKGTCTDEKKVIAKEYLRKYERILL